MADLNGVLNKINDLEVNTNKPHSQSLMTKVGENINGLIDGKEGVLFLGSSTFTVPKDISRVFVMAAGGGGGGAGKNTNSNGGWGADPILVSLPVTPLDVINITIGGGGAAGTAGAGGVGGTTLFGSFQFLGADGGEIGTASVVPKWTPRVKMVPHGTTFVNLPESSTLWGVAGAVGGLFGGTGGGAGYGNGGSASGAVGGAGGTSAGGGGGELASNGGPGGSGMCLVMW